MAQILAGQEPEQARAARKEGGELHVDQRRLAVRGHQPVLRLGKIVVGDAGPMQRTQQPLGVAEIVTEGDRLAWLTRFCLFLGCRLSLLQARWRDGIKA